MKYFFDHLKAILSDKSDKSVVSNEYFLIPFSSYENNQITIPAGNLDDAKNIAQQSLKEAGISISSYQIKTPKGDLLTLKS
jgi:hypothetical protein